MWRLSTVLVTFPDEMVEYSFRMFTVLLSPENIWVSCDEVPLVM